jgi:putative endopeptidase
MRSHRAMTRVARTLLSGLALAALLPSTPRAAAPPRAIDPLVQDMDTSVRPGTDFYRYAHGRWLKANPIPPAERVWGIGNLVDEAVREQLRGICESAAAANAPRGSVDQKVGDFWTTAIDSARADELGAKPLAPYLAAIDAIASREALLATIARFQRLGFGPLYGFYIAQDERNSDRYLVHLYQSGLEMPDRDYYFGSDSGTVHVRGEYVKFAERMFGLLGEDAATAKASAATVMRIETALAARSRQIEQLRDPWENYHPTPITGMSAMTPHIDWVAQLAAMNVPLQDTLVVAQPEFLAAADSCVEATPLPDWKTYLRWNVVNALGNRLSSPFERTRFEFYGGVLSGTKAMRPRWKRAIDAEEGNLGELMGQAWARTYCTPATKERYDRLTTEIFTAFAERVKAVPWMSAETKAKALAKLAKVGRKVGYPDHWRDYSALSIGRESYADNQVRVNTWGFDFEVAKLGKPVDRTLWDMTPQTYNAYYDPPKNEIVLPAAEFLIPGLPDSLVDDAILYGYAGGSTIGHELTHGFDDEGRQFDGDGNLNPWWTPQDSVEFSRRARKLVEQFDQYVVAGKHVRGQATLGENIADLGGVLLGYQAFQKTEQYRSGVKINGLTPSQRYFLGYSLSWLWQRRPESLANIVMTNVHAPEFLRVNGPLANVPAFYEAFGVKKGDPMWRDPKVRVEIW